MDNDSLELMALLVVDVQRGFDDPRWGPRDNPDCDDNIAAIVEHWTTNGGIRGTWDADDLARFADRMQGRIERLAPGLGSRIVARQVLGLRGLEARDANLIGGAINGGTAHMHQRLVFRPVPGLGRAETAVKRLYLGSASAHPGGDVHGAPGSNAARAAIAHDRARRLLPSMAGEQPIGPELGWAGPLSRSVGAVRALR